MCTLSCYFVSLFDLLLLHHHHHHYIYISIMSCNRRYSTSTEENLESGSGKKWEERCGEERRRRR